jgi:hypothetical protein
MRSIATTLVMAIAGSAAAQKPAKGGKGTGGAFFGGTTGPVHDPAFIKSSGTGKYPAVGITYRQ